MTIDHLVRGTLVLPEGPLEGGWLAMADARIVAIGTGDAPAAASVFDAREALVLPGVIDGQTHAGSYGGLSGLRSTTRSAVAGGVTTIVDMPYDNPAPVHTKERLDEKIAAIRAHAHGNVALYGTLMPGQPEGDLQALIDGGVVAFKISTFSSSPTRFPRIAASQMLDMFEALASSNIPLGVHNEDQDIVAARIRAAKTARREGIDAHSDSRPLAAELAATAHFLELGAAAGAHAHIVHLSAARGFGLVESYAREGFRATGELCVHYLWFDPVADGDELGARMKVNPPIRPHMIEALWQEVAAGRVAFISSDHSSWPIDNKNTPSIFDAGAGVPGLETLLPAFFTGAARRGLDAPSLTVAHLCERPARFFGLWPEKGSLRVGADGDIVILSRRPQVWNSANAHDDLHWSPFDGRTFDVRVARTYVGGALAFDGTDITNQPGDGRYVGRGTSAWFA